MALAYEGDNYRSKRSYISTARFDGSIFQYTTQLNGTNLRNEGRLTAITVSPNGTPVTGTTSVTFSATIALTTLTVTTPPTTGAIAVGMTISAGAAAGTIITAGSGTSWTVSVNQTVGSATSMTASIGTTTCPAGRILREIGAKLYPGVHPGLLVGDTFQGAVVGTTATNKFWVKVYDAQTGIRGYIDPNSTLFTVYNSDKSLEISDVQELVPGQRLGASLYTAGNLTVTTGRLTVGSNIAGQTTLAAGTKAITITGLTTNSIAFVTIATPLNGSLSVKYQATCTPDTLTLTALIAAGTINVADTSIVNYFVVN